MDERIAPEGSRWVCLACGKTERDLYGTKGGWDESCVLNARLFHDSRLVMSESKRTVIEILPPKDTEIA